MPGSASSTRPREGGTRLSDEGACTSVGEVLESDESLTPALLRSAASPVSTDRGSPRARTPGRDHAAAELARLRLRVRQKDQALARLTEAMLALRQGAQALREENRELRLQLEAAQRRSGRG